MDIKKAPIQTSTDALPGTARPYTFADVKTGLRLSSVHQGSGLPAIEVPAHITSAADLGQRIRAARDAKGFSQQQFADLAGVGRRFLSELENGKPTLEFDKVVKVALAAGIDLFAVKR